MLRRQLTRHLPGHLRRHPARVTGILRRLLARRVATARIATI